MVKLNHTLLLFPPHPVSGKTEPVPLHPADVLYVHRHSTPCSQVEHDQVLAGTRYVVQVMLHGHGIS